MRDNIESDRTMNRRSTLKALGASVMAAAVGTGTVNATGKPDYRRLIEQSHKVLQATNSVDKQHQFLLNRGIGTAVESTTLEFSHSGPSAQYLTAKETSLWFSLFSDCTTDGYPDGTYTAELVWEYDPDDFETGHAPLDYSGIGWRSGSWDYETNTLDDLYNSDPDWISYKGGTSGNGPAWEVDDNGTVSASQDNTRQFYTGVHLNWTGDSPSETTISASYSHTWNNVTVSGVSVGYPFGVSVTVSNENEEWTKDYNDSGEFLRLSKYDAEGCRY